MTELTDLTELTEVAEVMVVKADGGANAPHAAVGAVPCRLKLADVTELTVA